MNKRLTDQEKIEIVEKYKTGRYTCESLGKEYGARGDSINGILRRRGVPIMNDRSILSRKYVVNHNYFDIIDTEEKAYWLGFLYADGYNNEKNGIIEFGLLNDDIIILEKYKLSLGLDKPIYYDKKTNMCKVTIYSKHMSQQLAKLGCFQKKSLTLKFPTEEQVPPHLINHFVRGLWDGDGCIYYSKSTKGYCVNLTSTNEVCLNIKDLIKKILNVNFGIYDIRNLSVTKSLCLGGNKQSIKFLDWLYHNSSIYLDRKYEKYQIFKTIYRN